MVKTWSSPDFATDNAWKIIHVESQLMISNQGECCGLFVCLKTDISSAESIKCVEKLWVWDLRCLKLLKPGLL